MSELTLYLAPGTCAMPVRIALVEANAPHRIQRLDLAAGEQRSPAYLAINPKGRVPALVTERGVLTETPALLLYVAQRFPEAQLAPLDDPFLLACRRCTASWPPPSTSPMPTGAEPADGPMTSRPSPPCRPRCPGTCATVSPR